jgi:hypothetical protein
LEVAEIPNAHFVQSFKKYIVNKPEVVVRPKYPQSCKLVLLDESADI